MKSFWSSLASILLSVTLLVQLIEPITSARAGGGRRTGSSGGSGGSRYGSSSRSGSGSWGSSSSSNSGGGGRFGSSSPSGSSSSGGSRFGSSSPSGGSWAGASGSRYSAGAGAGAVGSGTGGSRWGSSAPSGSSRPNYNAAGNSAAKSAANRPAVNPPTPSQRTNVQPVYNSHTTVINNYGGGGGFGGGFSRGGFGTGSLLLAGAGGMVGGYLLGSMVARSMYSHNGCCYSCGCGYYGPPPPWYYDTYVPYRYRYQTETTTAPPVAGGMTAAPKMNPKPTDICTLARWNMELPFTEMPNMALTFLSTDNISGEAVADKARFFSQFLNSTAEPYGTLPATTNVFQIDSSYNLRTCNFNIPKLYGTANVSVSTSNNAPTERPFYSGALMDAWRDMVRKGDTNVCKMFSYANIPECANQPSGPEEPFFTAIKRLTSLYGNPSDTNLLQEIVSSAKKCYPKDVTPPKDIIPCLDYSVDSAQISSLENPTSVFGNEEMCRKYLNPDISQCIKEGSTFSCTLSDLVNLNVFARNYYLCKEPVDEQLVTRLQARQSGQIPNAAVPKVSGSDNTIVPQITVPNSVRSGPGSSPVAGRNNAMPSTYVSQLSILFGLMFVLS